jgi:hypothetical protein
VLKNEGRPLAAIEVVKPKVLAVEPGHLHTSLFGGAKQKSLREVAATPLRCPEGSAFPGHG